MPAVRDKDAVTGNGHVNQGQPGGLKHIGKSGIGNPGGMCMMTLKTPKLRWSDMTEVTPRQVIWIMF
jgi:hypothetical protein